MSFWTARGRQYVVGADIGEGLAHGDAFAAVVLDRETGEQVAEVHGRVPVEQFAHMLDALGRHYNKARLAVERNNHGHSALNTLRHTCLYPTLYHHKAYDQSGSESQVLGYPTDQKTKPIMVDDFAAANGLICWDDRESQAGQQGYERRLIAI